MGAVKTIWADMEHACHGGTENDAGCCCIKVLMTLHAYTLHGYIEDEVGRHGACMLAEYEMAVTSLHGSAGDEETTGEGRSTAATKEKREGKCWKDEEGEGNLDILKILVSALQTG